MADKVQVAAWNFGKTTMSIKELRAQVAELRKELGEQVVGSKEAAKAAQNLRQAQEALRVAEKGATDVTVALDGSYNALSTRMAQLKAQYHAVTTDMERNALAKQINEIDTKLKEMDANVGQFGRNVGNYAGSLAPLFGNFGSQIANYATKIGQITAAMEGLSFILSQNTKKLSDTKEAVRGAESAMAGLKDKLDNTKEAVRGGSSEVVELNDKLGQTTEIVKVGDSAMVGYTDKLVKMNESVKGSSPAMDGLKNGINGVGKSLKTLLANPIVVTIAAVVLVVMKLVDAFKKTDTAMTNLQKAFDVFKPVVVVVNKIFSAFVETISEGVLAISNFVIKAAGMIESLFGIENGFANAAKAAQNLTQAEDDLQEKERKFTVDSAKRSRDVAELQYNATQKDIYSYNERIKFLEQAIELEKQTLEDEKDIAEQRYKNAKKRAEQDADTTDETLNNLAQLKAASIKAEEEYNKGTRRLLSQLISARQEEATAAQNAAKARIEAAKKAREEEIKAVRETEDLKISLLKNGYEREYMQLTTAYEREIDALEEKLDMDKSLTETAYNAIAERITLLSAKYIEDINQLRIEEEELGIKIKEEHDKQVEEYEKEQEERRDKKREDYYNLLISEYATELDILRNSYDDKQKIIDAAYENQLISQEEYQRQSNRLTQAHALAMANVYAQRISQTADIFGEFFGSLGENMEEGTKEYKAMMVAQATMSMLSGITMAMSGLFTTKTGPWDIALAVIQAATIAASGAANISKILSTQPGEKETPNVSQVASTSISSSARSSLQEPDMVGSVTGESQIKAIQDMKVYVTEKDITDTQKKVSVAEKEATF